MISNVIMAACAAVLLMAPASGVPVEGQEHTQPVVPQVQPVVPEVQPAASDVAPVIQLTPADSGEPVKESGDLAPGAETEAESKSDLDTANTFWGGYGGYGGWGGYYRRPYYGWGGYGGGWRRGWGGYGGYGYGRGFGGYGGWGWGGGRYWG